MALENGSTRILTIDEFESIGETVSPWTIEKDTDDGKNIVDEWHRKY